MRQVAGASCDDGTTCDGVWIDGWTLVLRGEAVEAVELARAPHEAVVRVPVELVRRALAARSE